MPIFNDKKGKHMKKGGKPKELSIILEENENQCELVQSDSVEIGSTIKN
jgi:hypothetical protein